MIITNGYQSMMHDGMNKSWCKIDFLSLDFGVRWYDPARPGTTTMDPLCERHPWESPYLWCAGNPVRNIDPTGLFSFENIDKNSHYPLIVVFPQQFAIDRVLKMDYEASHKANIPMMLVEELAGYKYDGSNGLKRHPIVNSIVGLLGKNYSNKYQMSVRGAPKISIFNLTIDKNKGIQWNNGNKNILKRWF